MSTALVSMSGRGFALAISLITVPLVVDYLGAERYGMWLTVSALVAVLGPLDLGIGNGLLQSLADADGRDDPISARQAVSTAISLLGLIALVVFAIGFVASAFAPWARIFNVTSSLAIEESGAVATILIAVFAVGMPLSVGGIIQSAYQSGYVTAAWAAAGSLASLVALIIAISLHAGLPVLALCMAGAGVAAATVNVVVLFRRQRPWLAPRLHDFSRTTAGNLFRTGGLFLVLQLAGLAAYQLDNVVIAQIMGAAAVQEYAIPLKLFSLAPTIVGFGLMPVWPAYREALARSDAEWVLKTLRRSTAFALGINVPAAMFLVVAGPLLIHAWVGSAVTPTPLLLVGLGIWTALNGLGAPLAMLLNGAGAMKFQAACAIAMTAANLTISIFLVQRIGVAGAVYGSVVAQIMFILIPNAWYVPRLLASVRRSQRASAL